MLFSFLNRAWSIVSTLGFVAIAVVWLSPELQGFYFTFISLLVLLQVADMGFGAVLTQFASHEWADLRREADGGISGSARAKARLGSLVAIGLRWYSVAAILFFVFLGAGGHWFFSVSPDAASVEWVAPWWLLSFFASVWLLLVPVTGLLEGCGQVERSQRNQLCANILGSAVGWGILLSGGELYAIPALFAVRALIGHALNTRAAWPLFRLRSEIGKDANISWRRDFWPQQWRIWVSWLCGFFIFQSFTPIAFQIEGAVIAGQVGLMVQAFHAVNQLASARISVDQPRLGGLAARADFSGMRALVRRGTKMNLVFATGLAVAAIGVVYQLKISAPELGPRLGGLIGFVFFVATAIPLQLSNMETTAVRFQKKEPFVFLNALTATTAVGGSLLIAWSYGAEYMGVVFFTVVVTVLIPGVHFIYSRNMGALR